MWLAGRAEQDTGVTEIGMTEIQPSVLDALKEAVGRPGWEDDPQALEPYLTEWRGMYTGSTPLLVAPATAAEAAAVLRICNQHGVAVVPQGGNTGLTGGGIPGLQGRPEILLSSRRLKRIRATDPDNFTMTVEAGVVLADVQAAAAEQGFYFPLSLAAEGSCQIGGNLATNAGGTNVLRYGNTRDLVLGLEVVLPSGEIWNGLTGLRKDNSGYDLRNLFVGAEGTLGFITAATLKLFPAPRSRATAWLTVADPAAAVALYADARQRLGDEMVGVRVDGRECHRHGSGAHPRHPGAARGRPRMACAARVHECRCTGCPR